MAVVVFGSLNLDYTVVTPRFPRDGETMVVDGYKIGPGGKGGNQAVAASRMGAETYMVGALGNDANAMILENALSMNGVHIDHLQRVEEPTGAAFITVDREGENRIIVGAGANYAIGARTAFSPGILKQENTLLAQMELPNDEVAEAILLAKSNGMATVLNFAPAGYLRDDVLEALDLIIANEQEAHELQIQTGKSVEELGRSNDGPAVIVTLGSRGAQYFGDVKLSCEPQKGLDIVGTTGAGDAFCGIVAACLDKRFKLEPLLRFAVAGSGLACTAAGAQGRVPTFMEIEEAAKALPIHRPHDNGHMPRLYGQGKI